MTDSLNDFVAGTAGGFAGKLLDYPLDTVKVLLQTQPTTTTSAAGATAAETTASAKPYYRGAWHALTHTLQTGGVSALYKGVTSPLLGSMAENALLFYAYSHFKRFLGGERPDHELSLWHLSLAGAGAGAAVPLVLTPVEVRAYEWLCVKVVR